MKILAVTHDLQRGGAPTALRHLLTALRDEHAVTLLSHINRSGPLASEFAAAGIQLARQVTISDHDLVLCNTIATAKVVMKAKAVNRPVLWWIHEGKAGPHLVQGGGYDVAAFAAADLIVFPTAWQPRVVYRRWLEGARWTVVPMGTPAPQPGRTRPYERDGTDFVIVQVGDVNLRKGADLTIGAVRSLADPSIQVRFVGNPDPAFPMDTGSHEAEQFNFLGPLPHEQTLAELEHADVVVLPTRDDLIPLSVIEAMMLGRPVLTSDFGPIPETVRQGRTGLLSPVNDHRILAGNIAMLRRDAQLRADLGRTGRLVALRKHAFADHVAAMRDAIDRVAGA